MYVVPMHVQYHHESSSPRYQRASFKAMHFRSTYCSSQVLTQHIHNKKKTGKAQRASMAQEELQESKLTKAGGRKPTHGCNYPMVGWPSVIFTPMGPSLNLTREHTSRPSLRSSLSLSLLMHVWTFSEGAWVYLHILVCAVVHVHCACMHGMGALCQDLQYMHAQKDPEAMV